MTRTIPDLRRFDGWQPGAVIRTLKGEGYEIIGGGADSVVLSRPEDDFVVRVTNFASQADAFAGMCQNNRDNPFFPEILDTHYSVCDPPVFITVMEKLLPREGLDESLQGTLGGWGRALATLPDGHESHDDAHEQMFKSPEIAAAVFAILETMENGFGDQTFLYYDSGFSEAQGLSIEEWFPDNIMYRPLPDGGYQPVFIDPFREAFAGDDPQQRDALLADLKVLRRRAETLSGTVPKKDDISRPAPMRGPAPG